METLTFKSGVQHLKNNTVRLFQKSLKLIAVWLFVSVSGNTFAAYESYSVRKNALQITEGSSFFIIDGKFSLLSTGDFADQDVHTQIHFGVDESPYYTNLFDFTNLEIDLTLTPYDNSNSPQATTSITLKISYSDNAGDQYVDLDYYELAAYHKVKITIDDITGTIAPNVYLEAIMKVDRYYHIDDTNIPDIYANQVVFDLGTGVETVTIPAPASIPSTPGNQLGELELAWDYIVGAEEYELEWTWVDNYDRTSNLIPMTVRDFELNNTRIITKDQTYRIPVVYAEGYILYRVRAIGRWSQPGSTQDFDRKYYGKWSTHGASLDHVDDWTDKVAILEPFELLKNWQYQAVYAELGKKKEVISFFDGTLRSRQTVTRINSNNEVIAGETIYDNQGRAGIQVLPAPVGNPALRYYYSLNENSNNDPYSHFDFDWDDMNAGPCASVSALMDDASGAAKYYSANNTVAGNWQDYVPQSEGYPFIQTEYTPDNTGRVRRQSGVGDAHKIGSGHETEYFYLQPYQEELDRLFGYEVGYKSRYKKNLVVDANGQVSVSYLDPQGRVIATGLAGTNSTGGSAVTPTLISLGSELSGNHAQQVVDLLNKLDEDDEDTPIDDNDLFSTGNYGIAHDALKLTTFVTSTDDGNLHEFEYRVRTGVFADTCMPEGTGYPFAYKLKIDLLDDCGYSVLDDGTPPNGPILEDIVGTHSTGYTSALGTDQTFTFDATLNTGAYALQKIIQVDEEKLDEYLADYIANNECLFQPEDFDPNSEIDCGEELEIPPVTVCSVTEKMMLTDLSLGGQYGAYQGGIGMFTSVYAIPNVLDNGSAMNFVNNWQNPVPYYKNADGTPAYVNYGGVPTVPEALPYDIFIANWKPSWAEALLTYHPEYCYAEYYNDLCNEEYTINGNDYSSESFDAALLAIDTYDDASNSTTNAFNLNLTTDVSTLWNVQSIDPLFNLSGTEYDYIESITSGSMSEVDLMKYLMNAALNNYHGESFSMFEFAMMSAVCGTDFAGTCTLPSIGSLSTAQKDQVWIAFRSFYISEKKKINQFFVDMYTIKNQCHNGYIGDQEMDNSFMNFTYYPTLFDDVMDVYTDVIAGLDEPTFLPPWFFTGGFTPDYSHHFDDKLPRFISSSNLYNSGVPDDVAIDELEEQTDAQMYNQTGQCPLLFDIQYFLDALAQGDYFGTDNIPANSVPQLSADLYTAMGGTITTGGTAVLIDNDINVSNDLEIIVSNAVGGGSLGADIVLDPPAGLAWSTYNTLGGWTIEGMNMMYYVPTTSYNFKILAQINQSGTITEVVMTGTTTIAINCTYDQPCEKQENFGEELANLFAWLEGTGELTNTTVDVPLDGNLPWYENSELQTQLQDFASDAVYDGVSAGVFEIETTDLSVKVNFGSSYPANMSVITGGTFDGSILTIYYIDTSGDLQSATATVTFTDLPSTPADFDFDCGCEEQVNLEQLFQDFLNVLLDDYYDEGLASNQEPYYELDLMEPYLSVTDPLAYNFSLGRDSLTFAFNKSDCKFTFEEISSGTIGTIVQVYNVVFTHTDGEVTGITFTALLDNGSTIQMETTTYTGCLSFEDCTGCGAPMPIEPVSCTDAYDDYNTLITGFNTAILTDPDPDLDPEDALLFPVYTVEEFCDKKLAYITEAYLYYLDITNVTTADDEYYLSISEFGTSEFGYNNDELIAWGSYFPGWAISNPGQDFIDYSHAMLDPPSELIICPQVPLSIPIPDLEVIYPCEQLTQNADTVSEVTQYAIYLQNTIENFKQRYIEQAMASLIENMTMEYPDKEYHYTLYYYDQAGNLIQTVPPAGVDRIETEMVEANVDDARLNNTTPDNTTLGIANVIPEHKMATNYRYNSLNQLVWQNTPDGGISRFAYDALGRLVVSQNEVQIDADQMSYTKYDDLGRIIEVGEMDLPASTYTIDENGKMVSGSTLVDVSHPDFPENISSSREEVVVTIYDKSLSPSVEALFDDYADNNTRNRITGVLYFDTFDNTTVIETEYANATFYDYDVHGNVKEVIQKINDEDLPLLSNNPTAKSTKYEYELVSGNVKQVTFEDGEYDEFNHRYSYDSDNRITKVFTSPNGRIWEQDAKYFYYDHGPLARTEIGDKKVQATDFAYTLQNWLKGTNAEDVSRTSDIGKDGLETNINHMNAADAYAYTLHYFADDYNGRFDNDFMPFSESGVVATHNYDLYNGNIKEMYTSMRDENESFTALGSSHTMYRYDQLNRISAMNQETVVDLVGSPVETYESNYTYDANGNLMTLERYYRMSGVLERIDDLVYIYENPGLTNRLEYVADMEGNVSGDDLENWQGTANYEYDSIGQLTKDVSEDIGEIKWTVTGRVKEIIFNNSLNASKATTTDRIIFNYDAMGRRISKKVVQDNGDFETTYYFMDAQGNPMSIYRYEEFAGTDNNLYLTERYIYGSSRVGMELSNTLISSEDPGNLDHILLDPWDVHRFVGDKRYEMSNHLGNVLNVVTDRKLAEEVSGDHLCFASASSQYAKKATSITSASLGISSQMTISGWVKTTGTGNYTVAAYYNGGGVNKGLVLGVNGGLPVLTGRNNTGSGFVAYATTNIADGNWHYLVATVDNAASVTWKIYVDGQLENTVTGTTGTFNSMNEPFYIGANVYGAYMDGCIKEVTLWNVTKTEAEIAQYYATYSGYTGTETGLKGYWKIDEGTGTTLNDLTASNNDLGLYTNPNYPTWSSDTYLAYYLPDVESYSDYYPFGMMLPGRNNSGSYRHSFNGMEKDDEVYNSSGTSYDFGARIYNPRIGRWLSRDAMEGDYVPLSPYHFALNSPIYFIDGDGNVVIDGNGNVVKINYDSEGNVTGFDPTGVDKATVDALNSYMSSEVGKTQLKNIDQTVTRTSFSITDKAKFSYNDANGKNELVFGEVKDNGNLVDDGKGGKVFEEATVVIYMGSYEILKNGPGVIQDDMEYEQEYVSATTKESSVIMTTGKKIKKEGVEFVSQNGKINLMNDNYKMDIELFKQGVLIHESVHLESENIKIANDKKAEPYDHEIPAYKKEYELHKEKKGAP